MPVLWHVVSYSDDMILAPSYFAKEEPHWWIIHLHRLFRAIKASGFLYTHSICDIAKVTSYSHFFTLIIFWFLGTHSRVWGYVSWTDLVCKWKVKRAIVNICDQFHTNLIRNISSTIYEEAASPLVWKRKVKPLFVPEPSEVKWILTWCEWVRKGDGGGVWPQNGPRVLVGVSIWRQKDRGSLNLCDSWHPFWHLFPLAKMCRCMCVCVCDLRCTVPVKSIHVLA